MNRIGRRLPKVVCPLLAAAVLFAIVGGCSPTTGGNRQVRQVSSQDDSRRALVRQQAFIVHIVQTASRLDAPEVQRELGLSSEVVEQVGVVAADVRQEFAGLRTASGTEKQTKVPQVWLPAARTIEARIEKLLTPKQHARLVQIVLQKQIGAIALLVPHVIEQLVLTESQQRAIEDIAGETIATSEQNTGALLGLLRIAEAAREARKRAMTVLTPQQCKAWEALLGKPI